MRWVCFVHLEPFWLAYPSDGPLTLVTPYVERISHDLVLYYDVDQSRNTSFISFIRGHGYSGDSQPMAVPREGGSACRYSNGPILLQA